MELKSLTCPHCGAETSNTKNCEHCGSMFVRFVANGIDIDYESYLLRRGRYPELFSELKKNIQFQESTIGLPIPVQTHVMWPTEKYFDEIAIVKSSFAFWADEEKIECENNEVGLTLVLTFLEHCDPRISDFWEGLGEDQRLRLRSLECYDLFMHHLSTGTNSDGFTYYVNQYAIELGRDVEEAEALITEILFKVKYLIPPENYDIITSYGADKDHKAWIDKVLKNHLKSLREEPLKNDPDNHYNRNNNGSAQSPTQNNNSSYYEYEEENNYTWVKYIGAAIIALILLFWSLS